MKHPRAWSVVIAGLTVLAWQFPWGAYALYPFTILASYVHELGHGLAAMAVGARFDALTIHANGSGLAAWSGAVGRLGVAVVAAGGLVGPSAMGGLLLRRRGQGARAWLTLLAALVWGSLAVAEGLFTHVFALSAGACLLLGAWGQRGRWAPWILQFVAVQLCLSVFRDLDYMFSQGGMVDGEPRVSDSQAIAEALLLPYWFWGGLTATLSFALIVWGTARSPQASDGPEREQNYAHSSPS